MSEPSAAAIVSPRASPSGARRVLIVDAACARAEGVAAALDRASPGIRIVRVDSLPALEAALRGRDWDAVLVAEGLPRAPLDGCLERLTRADPELPVLVTAPTPGEDLALRALAAGAREVLDEERPEDVVASLAALALGPAAHRERGAREALDRVSPPLRALARLAQALPAAGHADEALAATVDVLADELELPHLESWLPHDGHGRFEPGPARLRDEASRVLLEELDTSVVGRVGLVREVARDRVARTVRDLGTVDADAFRRAARARSLGFDAAHAVPVATSRSVAAVLVALARPERPLAEEDLVTIEAAAAMLAEALARHDASLRGEAPADATSTLLDHVGDGIMACDADGRLTLVNRAMKVLLEESQPLGSGPDAWGRGAAAFMLDATTPMPSERLPLLRSLRGEVFEDEEHVIVAASGRRRVVRASGHPIVDPSGAPAGAVVAFRDVTDRVAAEADASAATARALATYALLLDDLADLGRRVGEAGNLDGVWHAILDFAHHTLGADSLDVVRSRQGSIEPSFSASRLTERLQPDRQPRSPGRASAEACAERGTPSIERDGDGGTSFAAVPLLLGGSVLGALAVGARAGVTFDATALSALTMAANLAAIALDHADLVEGERHARAQAETAALHFAQIFNANPAAITIASLEDDRILEVNPAFEHLIGFGREELLDRRALDLDIWLHPDDRDSIAEEARAGRSVRGVEVRLRRKDGQVRTCLLSADATTLRGEAAMLVLIVDATDRLEQQHRLRTLATFRESLMGFIGETLEVGFDGAFYQRLLESAVAATPGAEAGSLLVRDAGAESYRFVAAVGYDLDGLRAITFFDAEIAQASGDGMPVVTGALPTVQEDSDRAAALRRFGRLHEIKSTISIPIHLGGRRVAALSLDNFQDGAAFDEESKQLAVAFATQVAALIKRRALEQELEQLAYHDNLTGLPNRVLFRDRLQQAIGRANRTQRRGAAIFVDLDNLKVTNDALGHAVGDRLLKAVAERLASSIRADDTVARFGGDEFTVVLPDVGDATAAAFVAEKLLHALRAPFSLSGHEVHVTASIGITLFPDDGSDADTLIQHGDTAMYQAKANGKDQYRFFTREMNEQLLERATLEAQLRKALERDELTLHFQPRVRLSDGAITSVEALARWHHPERGWISPSTFIPVAEDSGLITSVGEHLLRRACAQARAWMDGGTPVKVAFNLSAKQLQERGVVDAISSALADAGVPGRLLELELTESALMRNVGENVLKLDELRSLGISISIDDFGTAYSSLNYLKRLPATALKIDQSFVGDVDAPNGTVRDAAIVRAVVALATALDLTAIAEGVETVEQLQFLRVVGCEQAQGYYFARPGPPGALAELLQAGRIDLPPAPGQ